MHPWRSTGAVLLMTLGVGCWCFVRGTRIATPTGPRPIDTLREGDEVWSWSFTLGAVYRARVTATHRAVVDGVLRLRAGELVVAGVSAPHPFWSATAGRWCAAGELVVGERLLGWLGEGEVQEVAVDTIAAVAGSVEVFNLTIDGDHDYFAEGLLVHNKSQISRSTGADRPTDADGDAFGYWEDCDDEEADVNLWADEICDDEIDNDCDEDIDGDDEDCPTA